MKTDLNINVIGTKEITFPVRFMESLKTNKFRSMSVTMNVEMVINFALGEKTFWLVDQVQIHDSTHIYFEEAAKQILAKYPEAVIEAKRVDAALETIIEHQSQEIVAYFANKLQRDISWAKEKGYKEMQDGVDI